ncbi:MAG: hypothetical protein K5899_01385 [Bacteroidaceae bacterium]|nr:hypothetical protein [Bacteroidaceae bacterium]
MFDCILLAHFLKTTNILHEYTPTLVGVQSNKCQSAGNKKKQADEKIVSPL